MKTFPFERISPKIFRCRRSCQERIIAIQQVYIHLLSNFCFSRVASFSWPLGLAVFLPAQEAAGFVLRVVSRPNATLAGSTSAVHCVRRNPIQGPFFLCLEARIRSSACAPKFGILSVRSQGFLRLARVARCQRQSYVSACEPCKPFIMAESRAFARFPHDSPGTFEASLQHSPARAKAD